MAKRPKFSRVLEGNPLDYVDGQALGRHLRGGVEFPAQPKTPKTPVQVIAGTPRKKRTGAGGYSKGAGRPS